MGLSRKKDQKECVYQQKISKTIGLSTKSKSFSLCFFSMVLMQNVFYEKQSCEKELLFYFFSSTTDLSKEKRAKKKRQQSFKNGELKV